MRGALSRGDWGLLVCQPRSQVSTSQPLNGELFDCMLAWLAGPLCGLHMLHVCCQECNFKQAIVLHVVAVQACAWLMTARTNVRCPVSLL